MLPPIGVQFGMMITGIIGQYEYPSTCMATDLAKLFHKGPKGFCVKDFPLTAVYELSISQAYGTEVANSFSRWMLQNHRMLALRRDPHAAPRSMLLEMDFV